MIRILTLLAAVALTALPAAHASERAAAALSSPLGLWQPLDSAGKPLGLIRIFETDGLYYGRIEPTSPSDDDHGARCTRCTDERHDQPIIGLVLMRHLKFEDGEYVGGDILDPSTGRVYGCTVRLINDGHELVMRGFLGFSLLGRSQIWRRVEGSP